MKASKNLKVKGAQFYKIGDKVESIRDDIGAWFTADIIDILPNSKCECVEECQCMYKLLFEGEEDVKIVDRPLSEIRQVSYSSIDWDKLEIGMKVVINYNIEKPKQWGYWYDYIIEEIKERNNVYFLTGTLLVGNEGSLKKLPIKIDSDHVADVLEIRPHATLQEKEMEDYETGVKPEYCKKCKNKPKVRCRVCCCCKCGNKKDFELTVQCDECADWYHIYCIKPPVEELPKDEDWYCPKCDNEAHRAKLEKKLRFKKLKRQRCINESSSNCSVPKPLKVLKKVVKKASDDEVDELDYDKDNEVQEITKKIPKDSHIWNQIKELFPSYDLVRVTAQLTKKKGLISSAAEEFIHNDVLNKHLWEEAKQSLAKGKKEFLEEVKRIFTCAICCDLLDDPITLSCKHSFCIDCFFTSLSVNVYNCALCRVDVIHTQHYVVNENLKGALSLLLGKKLTKWADD